MSKVFFSLFFACFSLCSYGQRNFNWDSLTRTNSNFTLMLSSEVSFIKPAESLLVLEKNYDLNFRENKNELFQSLYNLNLSIHNLEYSPSPVLQLDFKQVGKPFFDINYEGYRKDLSRYIQRAPDILWLCPIY